MQKTSHPFYRQAVRVVTVEPNLKDLDLTTHANVSKYALNGKLYGSVAHLAGYIAMPSASLSISSCDISKIKSWIDSGSKNN